ncbi:unnamed protein product [Rotaria sp. Silwood2]|nr:unnamed protein product [Rotaria sp. Silwood2]CAF3049970.1 unnamed protein product [Rotaria sp. Silwood2]CAF3279212.1 unnamed protein product [Rotaria sp. Silwood2]CAF3383912.1 unnamed protein product [Rotaria sp. Silwood2]
MDNSIEDESDSDYFDDPESGSEAEDGESQTSEDNDEIDLENFKLNDDSTWQSSYSSRSGMTWSSISHRSTKTNSSNHTIEKAGPTEITEDVSSIEDAFICFMSEKIIQKILIYSNMEYIRNIASNEKPQEITMMELKAFIGLLLLAGVLGKFKDRPKMFMEKKFDDKTTREERKRTDKFTAIREIWSDFQNYLKTCYTPGSYVTIDEQLLGFRGKCPFRQFMPKKPD